MWSFDHIFYYIQAWFKLCGLVSHPLSFAREECWQLPGHDKTQGTGSNKVTILRSKLAWENSWHFATPTCTGFSSLQNGIWGMRAETPYSWHNIAQIWLMPLSAWGKFSTNQKIWVVMHHQYGNSALVAQTSKGNQWISRLVFIRPLAFILSNLTREY